MSLHSQAVIDMAAIVASDFDTATLARSGESLGEIRANVAGEVQADHFGNTLRTPTVARITTAFATVLHPKDTLTFTSGAYAGQTYVVAHLEGIAGLRTYAARLEQEPPT